MKASRIAFTSVVLLAGAYTALQLVISPIILETHTAFLFSQIEEVLKKEENAPIRVEEFMSIIRTSEIDWNSCEMKENEILDGWKRSIRIEQHEGKWNLQSSGKNGVFGDSDDITRKIEPTNQAGDDNSE